MNRKSFLILTGVTAIMVIATIVQVTQSQQSLTVYSSDGERAFSGLAEKVNAVSRIDIVSSAAKFSVTRTEKGWGLKDKADYKVSFEKVKAAIVGLAELKLLESKTSDPKRYDRLQVEAPDNIKARSLGVTLTGADGKKLAAGIIGKRRAGLFATGGAGTYLRRDGEALSWLARGAVDLGAEPNDWMVREIVNIEAEDIRRAVIRQPDGAEIVITKPKRASRKYAVAGVPEGGKLKDSDEGKNMAGGLWRLSFEDVKKAGEVKFPEKFNVAEYETFSGLKVRVEMTFVDKTVVWGKFSATVDASVGDEKSRKKAKEQADKINVTATGWVYELSAGEGEKLTTKIGDILDKKKAS
jgi:hypothetical protein